MNNIKDLKGFEGGYAGTIDGHIYSYHKGGLKSEKLNKQGYYEVSLYKNGKVKDYRVHSLIAQTFIGEIPKGYCVNHKDECKTNNAIDNLEIVSISYNTIHGTAIERRAKANRGKIRSEECKQRMSDAHKGQFVSEETKKKMSDARLRYLQHQKGCVSLQLRPGKESISGARLHLGVTPGCSIFHKMFSKHIGFQ